MTTIRNTVVRADGTPVAGVRVLVYPVVPTDSPLRPHYPATDPTAEEEILLGGETVTDAAGDWTMDVEPSTALEPVGSVAYRVVQYPPGGTGAGAFDRIVVVPDSAAALWVPDLEELDPDDVTELAPLDAHAADTTHVHGIEDAAALVQHDGTLLVGGIGQVKSLAPPVLEHLDPAAIGTLTMGGVWDAGVPYDDRVLVTWDGGLWVSSADTVAGEEPGVAAVWVEIPTPIDAHDADDGAHLGTFALAPTPLRDVTLLDEASASPAVRPIGYAFGGVIGASPSNTNLYRSDDDGETWTVVATAPSADQTVQALECDDGELLVHTYTNIYKSSGWPADPSTATWDLKLTRNASATFDPWGVDGNGTKFIAVQYASPTRADSRYVNVSTDSGDTWTMVRDSNTVWPGNNSHHHAACYDPWEDRFWYIEGHDPAVYGLYYSDDNGGVWTRYEGPNDVEPAPTVMVATDHGIVCGTDNEDNGLLAMGRDLVLRMMWSWNRSNPGLNGFAKKGYRDPRTGIVYVGFRSDQANAPAVIAASDGLVGGLVYEDDDTGGSATLIDRLVVTPTGRLLAYARLIRSGVSTSHLLTADVPPAGASDVELGLDEAGLFPGTLDTRDGSLALGRGSRAGLHGTAIGEAAIAVNAGGGGDSHVAVGHDAQADGSDSTAIGVSSRTAAESVAVGRGALATNFRDTALGHGAVANRQYAVAIGYGALADSGTSPVSIGGQSAAGSHGVSVGHQATTAGGTWNVAIGRSANAANGQEKVAVGYAAATPGTQSTAIGASTSAGSNGVAIGRSATTTNTSGVAIGVLASASGLEAIALGRDAVAGGSGGIALGKGSSAPSTDSVAIGRGVSSTSANQVALGAKHIELTDVAAAPVAGAAGKGRLFVDAGALKYRGPSGTLTTVAPA